MKQYVYFFTRQDISPEQQLVQTAHVALKLGAAREGLEHVHFTVIGVRNLEALEAASALLLRLGHPFISFDEPDLGGETTSIVTAIPINEDERGELLAFNLLRFR